jgi:hypothetical protein
LAEASRLFPSSAVLSLARSRYRAIGGDLIGAVSDLSGALGFEGLTGDAISGLRVTYLLPPRDGDSDEVHRAYADFTQRCDERDADAGMANVVTRAAGMDAVALLGSEEEVRFAFSLLADRPDAVGYAGLSGDSFDRLRGVLALRLGLLEQASRHLSSALERCTADRCLVEAGRCHQGLAEVAERRGQHLEAMQHLDAAGEMFVKYGAKLYLDQVIAKKQLLKA